MKGRIPYFDNLKFALICLVVIGHFIEPLYGQSHLIKASYQWIYLFHIPLLVFVAGYFSKSAPSESGYKKIITRLVIPYFIFETLYTLADYALFNRPELIFSYFEPHWLMWYLFSMILWRVALPYVTLLKYPIIIMTVLALLVGDSNNIEHYFSLSRTFVFFPFFLAGYYFDKKHLNILGKYKVRIVSVLVLVSMFFVAYFYGTNLRVKILYGAASYESIGFEEPYAGLYRLIAMTLGVLLGVAFLSLIPNKRIPFLTSLGVNTMYPYLLHAFVIKYLDSLHMFEKINTPYEKILLVIGSLALTVILSTSVTRKVFRVLIEPNSSFLFSGNEKQNERKRADLSA
ncbi:MAG: acyltransferase family protein [Bacillus sp. (in: firmicutes)]